MLDLSDTFAVLRATDRGDERGQVAEVERRQRGIGRIEQQVADDLRAERRGRERLDPEIPVELPTRRIVDAGDDFRNAEHPLRDQRGHDVAVVAVGHGRETVGPLGAGTLEDVVVDTGADLDPAAETGAEPLEGPRIFVDDHDVVLGDQEFGERRADAPAPDD